MTTPSEELYGLSYVDAVDNAVRLARLADRSPGWSDDGDPEMVAAMAALSSAYSAVAHHLRAHDVDAALAAEDAADAADRGRIPSEDGP